MNYVRAINYTNYIQRYRQMDKDKHIKLTLAIIVTAIIYAVIVLSFLKAVPTTTVYYSVSQDQVVRVTRHGKDAPIAINNNEPYEMVYVK